MSKREQEIANLTTNDLARGMAEHIADLPYGAFDDETPEALRQLDRELKQSQEAYDKQAYPQGVIRLIGG